ncbi:hypothetical protein FQN60_008800, partial [Etheostoma spectabile]
MDLQESPPLSSCYVLRIKSEESDGGSIWGRRQRWSRERRSKGKTRQLKHADEGSALFTQHRRQRLGGGEGGDLGGVESYCAGAIEFGLWIGYKSLGYFGGEPIPPTPPTSSLSTWQDGEEFPEFHSQGGTDFFAASPKPSSFTLFRAHGTRSAAVHNFSSSTHLDSWRPSRRQIIDQSAAIRLWPSEHWGMQHAEQEEPQCDPTLCPSVTPCCPVPSLAWASSPLKPSVPEATSLDLYRVTGEWEMSGVVRYMFACWC